MQCGGVFFALSFLKFKELFSIRTCNVTIKFVRTYVICAYALITGVPVCGTPTLFDRTNFERRIQVKNVKNFD